MKTKSEILKSRKNSEGIPITDYIIEDGFVWAMILSAMEEYKNQFASSLPKEEKGITDQKEDNENQAWDNYRQAIFDAQKFEECKCDIPKPVTKNLPSFCCRCGNRLLTKKQ